MNIDFFTIWFFISPFIILHLYLKNKEYKNKANQVVQHINDVWDQDYKDIIMTYGSIDSLLEDHKHDYEIIRDALLRFYSQVSDINRLYMTKTELVLSYYENKSITKKDLYEAIKLIRRDICLLTSNMLSQLNEFIINEEQAHSENPKSERILDKIDKEYKNKNIKEEVSK